jgi:hypothetical protein
MRKSKVSRFQSDKVAKWQRSKVIGRKVTSIRGSLDAAGLGFLFATLPHGYFETLKHNHLTR